MGVVVRAKISPNGWLVIYCDHHSTEAYALGCWLREMRSRGEHLVVGDMEFGGPEIELALVPTSAPREVVGD